jgi:asparagine synthase (glutamine-hydrolysing)
LDLLQREVYSPADVQEMTGFDVMANSRQRLDTSTSYGSLVEAELANYMQGTLLADADTFSMCSSVELRVPFVDRSFFLAAVAANRGRWKRPSKRALGRSLNDRYLVELCTRRKRGFSVPMATWLTDGPLRMSVEALRDDDAPIWNVVRRDAPSLPADLTPGTGWSQLWSLASLNQWLGSLGGSET